MLFQVKGSRMQIKSAWLQLVCTLEWLARDGGGRSAHSIARQSGISTDAVSTYMDPVIKGIHDFSPEYMK